MTLQRSWSWSSQFGRRGGSSSVDGEGRSARAFALPLLVCAALLGGCGNESKSGVDLPTVDAPGGSTGPQTTTGGVEQAPGGGSSGTMSTTSAGSVPSNAPGSTASSSVGGTASSSVDSTSTGSSSTGSTSDLGTTTGGVTTKDTGETSSDDGKDTTPEPGPKKLQRYTLGHGDVGVHYDESKDDIFITVDVEDSIVDGAPVKSASYSPDQVLMVSSAKLERPLDDDADALSGLCVEKGQSVAWFPQTNHDSNRLKTPFFGWASRIRPLDLDGAVNYRITGFDAPSPEGHVSMWQDRVPLPAFSASSCDGLDGDGFVIETGHDHAHIGLSGAPGRWDINFRAELRLKNGKAYQKDFTLHFLTL